jgi:hypothetical protein
VLRRALLLALLAAPAAAHTPYRQWVVYRRKHLLVGCHRDDAAGQAAARAAVTALEAHLPDARSRVARAPAATRLAALLATDQLDLAVLAPGEVSAMMAAEGPFAAYGRIPLTALAPLGAGHALLAHARFRDDHAALVSEALAEEAADAPPPAPWHPGARRPE